MEAVTLIDYIGNSNDDEISFNQGDLIKILDKECDRYWYVAELNGQRGFVLKTHIHILRHSWYKGKISRLQASAMLAKPGNQIGAFLIRCSENEAEEFSLSVKYDKNLIRHFKVLRNVQYGLYYLWTQKFQSLNELIAHYQLKSLEKNKSIFLRPMKGDFDTSRSYVSIMQTIRRFKPREKDELEVEKPGELISVFYRRDKSFVNAYFEGKRGFFPLKYLRPAIFKE
uniref:Uncharacterized protein n=1 Tax=Panagrolaimus sp. PS1159 TaxID=55785 RepID=A0AC35GVC8_9BILA